MVINAFGLSNVDKLTLWFLERWYKAALGLVLDSTRPCGNRRSIKHNVSEINNQLTSMQSEFEKEYGTKDINISDGTINYEQTN